MRQYDAPLFDALVFAIAAELARSGFYGNPPSCGNGKVATLL